MFQDFLHTLGIIFSIFLYNKFYFYFHKKKIVFYDYFIKFLYYTIIFFILIYSFYDYEKLNIYFMQSLIGLYFISFVSIFFTISLKTYKSPTELIFKLVKKKISFDKLHKYLKKKKIISSRISDLKNQKLVKEKNGYLYLSPLGLNFCRVYFFLMKVLKIKSKG